MIISENKEKVSSSQDIYEVMKNVYKLVPEEDKHKELVYCIGLDSNNVILYIELVTMGTVNSASPVKRECLKLGIIKNVVNIVMIHNHPSGAITPSPQDENFTKELKDAGKLLDIGLLDHLIIGKNEYYSFADNGAI